MYEWNIDNLNPNYVQREVSGAVQRLVFYLVSDYFESWQPEYEEWSKRRTTLLSRFFEKTNSEYRRQAAWQIKTFDGLKKANTSESIWIAARYIWKDRLDCAASLNYSSDFDAEITALSTLFEHAPPYENLVSLWPFLIHTLPYLETTRIWHYLENFVARKAESDPIRSIDIYGQMCNRVTLPMMYYNPAQARSIIEPALKSAESRSAALSLINHLARKGDDSFRDLYERYA